MTDTLHELTLAEAAAWLTRLQEPGRTAATEAAFKAWLKASPAHARAFARVNEIWESLPGAAASTRETPMPRHHARAGCVTGAHGRHSSRARRRLGAAVCAIALLVAPVVMHEMQGPVVHAYQTAVGAQRTIVLADNTRVTLNTDTRIVVVFREHQRHVRLERGEALFKVEKDPSRSFTVSAGDARIADIGTIFDVRREPRRVSVSLLEGEVEVSTPAASPGRSVVPTVLAPGERLTVDVDGTRAIDRPGTREVLAWEHGKAYFDNTTLAAAVAELNRYGAPRLRLADPALAGLRVSGVFSVHDHEQFASAVASLHRLRVTREGRAIVLRR